MNNFFRINLIFCQLIKRIFQFLLFNFCIWSFLHVLVHLYRRTRYQITFSFFDFYCIESKSQPVMNPALFKFNPYALGQSQTFFFRNKRLNNGMESMISK